MSKEKIISLSKFLIATLLLLDIYLPFINHHFIEKVFGTNSSILFNTIGSIILFLDLAKRHVLNFKLFQSEYRTSELQMESANICQPPIAELIHDIKKDNNINSDNQNHEVSKMISQEAKSIVNLALQYSEEGKFDEASETMEYAVSLLDSANEEPAEEKITTKNEEKPQEKSLCKFTPVISEKPKEINQILDSSSIKRIDESLDILLSLDPSKENEMNEEFFNLEPALKFENYVEVNDSYLEEPTISELGEELYSYKEKIVGNDELFDWPPKKNKNLKPEIKDENEEDSFEWPLKR